MEDTVLQDEEVPEEIEEQCVNCHHSLAAIERIIKPLFSSNMADMEDEAKMDKIEKASLILLLTYTMNSLFWVYTTVHGVNPRGHGVKREMERIQKYMQQIKMLSADKKISGSNSKVKAQAAKRFIRNALFEGSDVTRKRGHNSDEVTPEKKSKVTTVIDV